MLVRFVASLAAAGLCAAALTAAQHPVHEGVAGGGAAVQQMTDQKKIQSAMSAAPPQIAKAATIMDHPAKDGDKPRQLRAGTNGWVCFPSTPPSGGASGDDPMCLDREWQKWADAWAAKKPPAITSTGIAYMLQGDRGASNTDPYATAPTATNQWVTTPAHIMVLLPDPKMLEAYPTDPKAGGPFVMWKGTPYAHVMVPVGERPAQRQVAGK